MVEELIIVFLKINQNFIYTKVKSDVISLVCMEYIIIIQNKYSQLSKENYGKISLSTIHMMILKSGVYICIVSMTIVLFALFYNCINIVYFCIVKLNHVTHVKLHL